MGKAYANRKKEEDRPDNDFYQTPKCMIYAEIYFNKIWFGVK